MFFIAYTFKGQARLFAGGMKIVGHSSCRTSAILIFVPCTVFFLAILFITVHLIIGQMKKPMIGQILQAKSNNYKQSSRYPIIRAMCPLKHVWNYMYFKSVQKVWYELRILHQIFMQRSTL